MRARDEMQRAAAAASWLVLGHPPVAALDALSELLTTGRMPAWYLSEAARAASAAAPLTDLITPMPNSTDVWVRVSAAVTYGRITGDTGTSAAVLAAALAAPGSPVLPVHVVAVEALADLDTVPMTAADRLREVRDSAPPARRHGHLAGRHPTPGRPAPRRRPAGTAPTLKVRVTS